MVGEQVYLTNVTFPATIASCNGGVATVGTVCKSGNPIVLDTNASTTVASETMHVASVVMTPSYVNGTTAVEYDAPAVSSPLSGAGTSTAFGDVNFDTKADILIGDPTIGSGGALYLVFGKTMPVLPQTTIITTSGSPNATVGNKTGLMTCQGIYSANTLSTGGRT